MTVVKHWNRFPRDAVVFLSWKTFKAILTEQGPDNCSKLALFFEQVLDHIASQGPIQPQLLHDSMAPVHCQ